MDKRAKQAILGSLFVLLIMIGLGAAALVRYFSPGKEWMELSDYYSVPEGEALLILDDRVHSENARLVDGRIYVDLETVKEYFNHRFYWDENEQQLTLATPTEIIRAADGEQGRYADKDAPLEDHAVVRVLDGEVYLSLEFAAEYSDISYQAYAASAEEGGPVQRVVVTCVHGDYLYVDTTKKTQIRAEADRKSEILKEVPPQEGLMLLDGGGTQQNSFLKVMTSDGVRGYVNKRHVGDGYFRKISSSYQAPEYTVLHENSKINLVWHYVETAAANQRLADLMKEASGVNVISPTWFRLNGSSGDFSSIADSQYVDTAHSMGLKVWGLVKNFDTGSEVDTYQVLSRTSSRDRLTEGLVKEALRFGLDGINVDFEMLSVESGPHFIQFLRELSVKCRINGLVLSVDNYVPASYNRFYDYEEQGEIVDYVIIMAYDEHTSISENAGSVASIGYVEKAITDTLAMVPADKIVVGIPFYTRLWKETADGDATRIGIAETPFMSSAEALVEEQGATPVWDEDSAQYYAEYEKNGALYRIWLEEERSIGEKVKRVAQNGLAGVAAWRLGQEKAGVWSVIWKNLNDPDVR